MSRDACSNTLHASLSESVQYQKRVLAHTLHDWSTYAQHVRVLEMCVQGIAETFAGVSGNQAALNIVTVSVHC